MNWCKKVMLFCVLFSILFCLNAMAADGGRLKVKEVSEEVGVTSGIPRDSLFRLHDGKNYQFVFWPTWNHKRQPHVDLVFKLDGRAEVDSLEIGIFRRNVLEEYNLTRVELYVKDENGRFAPAAMEASPQPIEGTRGSLTLPVVGVKGECFKLRLAGVKYVAVTEVIFRGKYLKETAADRPMLGSYQAAVTKECQGLTLREMRFDEHRGVELVIENPRMLWVITPSLGGMLNYAYDKRCGKNFVKSRKWRDYGGALGDKYQFGNIPQQFRLYHSPYQFKVIEQDEERLVLRLEIVAENSLPGPVVFSRDYIFRKDSSAVEVRHRIFNDSRNMVPYDEPFVIHSYLGLSTPVRRFCFKADGPAEFDAGMSVDVSDTVNATAGVTDSDGNGLALLPDFLNTAILRFFSKSPTESTVEAVQGARPVPADKSIETTIHVIPFCGLGLPNAVFPEAVAKVIREGRSLSMKISVSGEDYPMATVRTVEGKTLLKERRCGQETPLLAQYDGQAVVIELAFDNGQKRSFHYRGDTDFRIPSDLRDVRPLPAGHASYRKLDLNFNVTGYVPDDGPAPVSPLEGVAEIFMAGHGFYWCTEAVDLARRNGLRIRTASVGKIFRIGNNEQEVGFANSTKEYEEQLTKGEFSTMVFLSGLWHFTSEKLKKKVMKRVESGSALVLVCPVLPSVAPVARGKLVPNGETTLFGGLALGQLPAMDAMPLELDGAECLATIEGRPVIIRRKVGKGVVYGCYWNGYHRHPKANERIGLGLTSPDMQGHRWQLQLTARVILAAANALLATPPNIRVEGNTLVLEKCPAGCELALVWRDAFDQKVAEVKQTLDNETLTLSAPPDAFLAEILLVDARNGKIWPASAELKTDTAKLLRVEVLKDLWAVGDTLPVTLSVPEHFPADATFRIRLVDSWGRLFAECTGTDKEVTLPLKDGLGTAFELRATAMCDGRDISAHLLNLYFNTPHDTNEFTVDCAWLTVRDSGMNVRYIPLMTRALRQIGYNAVSEFDVDPPTTLLMTRQGNMTTPTFGEHGAEGTRSPGRNADSLDKYRWTRVLCPNGSRMHQNEIPKSAQRQPYQEVSLGRLGYDEVNAYVNDWDGCFCKDCQKAMRVWLQEKYATLAALNQAWHTDFSDWEKVVADSFAEAKKRGKYISWLDHREFQELSLVRGVRQLTAALHQSYPDAFFAMCGTQDFTPFRALDWAELMKGCGGLYSYVRHHDIMQRSFIPPEKRIFWLQWMGYYYPQQVMARRLAMHMAIGGSGVCVYNYSYLRPDFAPSDKAAELTRTLRPYLDGAGAALVQSTDVRPPIGVWYDARGFKLNHIAGHTSLSEETVVGIEAALSDVSLDYLWRLPEDLAGLKVLFIPAVDACSLADRMRLEEFVRAGGVLVSILSSGGHDRNCEPQKRPLLDSLLGLDTSLATRKSGQFSLLAKGELAWLNHFAVRLVSSGVKTTSAETLAELDGSPIITLQRLGKGKAYFFGCDFWSIYGVMGAMRNFGQFSAILHGVQDFLNSMGVPQKVVALNGEANAMGVRIIERHIGDASIINAIDYLDGDFTKGVPVLNDLNPELTFRLDGKYHCYDLFSREKLADGADSFRSRLKYDGGHLAFTMLKSPPKDVTVRIYRNGRNIQAEISASPHPLKVSVWRDGVELPSARKILPATANGQFRYSYPVALNESSGRYTVKVQDLLCDRQATALLEDFD